MSIREAFFSVCEDAKPASSHYVSLYCVVPYYGGPEEGGWWGQDTVLVAYRQYDNEEEAAAASAAVSLLAERLNMEARRTYGEHCLRQTEWLEARGLDDSYLPEVDGEESYFVTSEDTPGSLSSTGCRHYE